MPEYPTIVLIELYESTPELWDQIGAGMERARISSTLDLFYPEQPHANEIHLPKNVFGSRITANSPTDAINKLNATVQVILENASVKQENCNLLTLSAPVIDCAVLK